LAKSRDSRGREGEKEREREGEGKGEREKERKNGKPPIQTERMGALAALTLRT
jgi:hypothetical protein